MATVTIKKAPYKSFGGIRLAAGEIAMSNSYTTGGEAVDLGLKEVMGVFIENKNGYMFEYDRANKKVKVFTPTKAQTAHTHNAFQILNSQVAADQTAFVEIKDGAGAALTAPAYIAAAGGGSDFYVPTDSAGAISASAAAEVADATDLSALTGVAFLAWGW
jgi:hypothetical protein